MDSRTQLQALVEDARKQLEAIQDLVESPSMLEAVTSEYDALIAQAEELTSILRSARALQVQASNMALPIIPEEFEAESTDTPLSRRIPSPPSQLRKRGERSRSCPLDAPRSPLLEATERRNLKRTRSVQLEGPASSHADECTSTPAKFLKFNDLAMRLFADVIESRAAADGFSAPLALGQTFDVNPFLGNSSQRFQMPVTLPKGIRYRRSAVVAL